MAIILASSSAIRQQILRGAGVAFSVQPPMVDETALKALHPDDSAEDLAQRLANAKCLSVSEQFPSDLIVGADQVLNCAGRSYDKPQSISEARDHLISLRGQRHLLSSAVCCGRAGIILWQHTAQVGMTMRKFSDEFLDHYLAKMGNDALTSVGAYKIEGLGLQLFEEIDGDYFAILGLPLLPLLAFLRSARELQT